MSMVLVSGRTYRIVALRGGGYDAVRLLDDVRMGNFSSLPLLTVSSEVGGEALLRRIAHAALRGARTRWTTAGGLC
jgi:hypothetical protein